MSELNEAVRLASERAAATHKVASTLMELALSARHEADMAWAEAQVVAAEARGAEAAAWAAKNGGAS